MIALKIGIITASDKGSRGEREDLSAKVIEEMMEAIGGRVADYALVPDELPILKRCLSEMADAGLDIILTTGGTGLGPRDVTPDATLQVIERQVPGIAEAMRMVSLEKTSRAVLSRAVAGTRGRTLIINLPGSPKAVRECLGVVLDALPHAIEVLKGDSEDCARPDGQD